MSMDRVPRRTSTAVRRFEIWFGGIFLAIGLAALLVAGVLFLVLRNDPGMGSRVWSFLVSPLTIGAIFSALGAVYFRRGRRRLRTEERLLQFGTTTEATATAIEPTNTHLNRRVLWRVRFAYEDMHGARHEGDSGYLSAEDAQSYEVGEQVFVRYDPERPSTSIWLGREDLAEPS
jgi:hypothetical protein